jgi:hypothetical protein
MTDFDKEIPPATADGIPNTQDATTEFRYPDGRGDAAIDQSALDVDKKVEELIEKGSFDCELLKFTPHGGERLVTQVPRYSAAPETDVIDFATRNREQNSSGPDVEINDDGEDFAAGVRDPDERPESDDERGAGPEPESDSDGDAEQHEESAGDEPNEEASERQAPSTEPNEAEIAEFLTIISKYARQATEGMPNPGLLQLSKAYPDAKLAPQRFLIGDVDDRIETYQANVVPLLFEIENLAFQFVEILA